MDTRIQFRVNKEPKRLAQQMAESQGRTLSDACRELTVQLAEQQRKVLTHDAWLTEQVNHALEKLDSKQTIFIDSESAKNDMSARKARKRQGKDI